MPDDTNTTTDTDASAVEGAVAAAAIENHAEEAAEGGDTETGSLSAVSGD